MSTELDLAALDQQFGVILALLQNSLWCNILREQHVVTSLDTSFRKPRTNKLILKLPGTFKCQPVKTAASSGAAPVQTQQKSPTERKMGRRSDESGSFSFCFLLENLSANLLQAEKHF